MGLSLGAVYGTAQGKSGYGTLPLYAHKEKIKWKIK